MTNAERRKRIEGGAAAGRICRTITYQYFDSRVIEGSGARGAAEDFRLLAYAQAGITFHVSGRERNATIDLTAWPDGVAFGSWFAQWAERWSIRVVD